MSSENWELQIGMEAAGYELWGAGFPDRDHRSVIKIVDETDPSVVMVQDKREWDPSKPGCFDKQAAWRKVEHLPYRPDVFRATVIVDAHQDPVYHRAAHIEIGAHAWLHYYHGDIVSLFCPWLRPEHMIRIYHSVNRDNVPEFTADRPGKALLAGAIDDMGTYPLRRMIAETTARGGLPGVDYLHHPGYGANGSATPGFLERLSGYKVLIVTCSIFGYAIRKLFEGVACGCTVITDLSGYDELPEIDHALVRVPSDITMRDLRGVVDRAVADWDAECARENAEACLGYYDWRPAGVRAAEQIDKLRKEMSQ
jgi:hypothetical protein